MTLKKKKSVLSIVKAGPSVLIGPPTPSAKVPGYSQVTPPLGQVMIYSSDPAVRLTARMDGGFRESGGLGGWQIDDVPKQGQTTSPGGTELVRMEGTIVLHSFAKQSVEQQYNALKTLATKQPNRSSAPIIRMRGNVPYLGKAWVILAAPEIQRALWANGYRYSITLGLTVGEYNPPQLISTSRSKPVVSPFFDNGVGRYKG